ncbi:hypothetical protein C1646_769512, partial [Rhizophagus diaphanus]
GLLINTVIRQDREGVSKASTTLQYDEWHKKSPVGEFDSKKEQRPRPVELVFKLHLPNLRKKELPWLPPQFYYTKAIEDYLAQIRKLIQGTLKGRYPTVKFPQQRHEEQNLRPYVADCRGGTVDLTLRKLLLENKLSGATYSR